MVKRKVHFHKRIMSIYSKYLLLNRNYYNFQIITLDGIRGDTRKYFYDGFIYHLDGRANLRSCIYRCNTRSSTGCTGKIYVEAGRIVAAEPHENHEPEVDFLRKYEFRREIYRLCEESFDTFEDIFNNVSLR